tara:strand:- start:132 stop:569 length:438 start_codon:yes stop_codon:yes gene_type:complete
MNKTIHINLLTGEIISLDIDMSISILELKELIQFKMDIPVESQRLIYKKILTNNSSFKDCGYRFNKGAKKSGLTLIIHKSSSKKPTTGGKRTPIVVSKSSNKKSKKLNNKKADYVIKIVNGRKRKVFTGPKGGKYIISKNNKIYI